MTRWLITIQRRARPDPFLSLDQMTAPAAVILEDDPSFGQDRCLVLDEFAVAQAAGVFHKDLVVEGLVPIFHRTMGVLQGSGQALTPVADGATEFFEIVAADIGMGLERLRVILESRVIHPKMAGLAAISFF